MRQPPTSGSDSSADRLPTLPSALGAVMVLVVTLLAVSYPGPALGVAATLVLVVGGHRLLTRAQRTGIPVPVTGARLRLDTTRERSADAWSLTIALVDASERRDRNRCC